MAILARVKNGLYHREIAILKCACDVDGSLRGRPKSPLTQDSESSASRSRHQACHTSGRGALRIFNYQALSQQPRLWPSVLRTLLAPRHVSSHGHAGRFRLIELARAAINTFFTIRFYLGSSSRDSSSARALMITINEVQHECLPPIELPCGTLCGLHDG